MLTHWSCVFLALTHRYGLMVWLLCTKIYFRHPGRNWMITEGNKYQTLWSNYILQYTHYSYIMNYDGSDGISNHLHLHYLLNRLFRRRSKATSKLRITGLFEGNSPVSGEFPSQRASNAENVSIWWSHHIYDGITYPCTKHLHLWHIFTSMSQYAAILWSSENLSSFEILQSCIQASILYTPVLSCIHNLNVGITVSADALVSNSPKLSVVHRWLHR